MELDVLVSPNIPKINFILNKIALILSQDFGFFGIVHISPNPLIHSHFIFLNDRLVLLSFDRR